MKHYRDNIFEVIKLLFFLVLGVQAVSEFEKCVSSFVRRYAKSNVLYFHHPDNDLSNVFADGNLSHITMYGAPVKPSAHQVDTVLFAVGSLQQYARYQSSAVVKFALPRDVFAVIAYKGDDGELQMLLEYLWYATILNVVIVTADLRVYAVPLESYCYVEGLTYLGKCRNVERLDVRKDFVYFPNCTVRICGGMQKPFVYEGGFEDNEGFEVRILNILTRHLQLRTRFTQVMYVFAINQVAVRIVDLACGGLFTYNEKHDFVHYQRESEIALFIPTPKPRHPWTNTLLIFDDKTWLALFASIIFVTVTWYFCNEKASLVTSVMFTVSVLISSVPTLPDRNRSVFAIWAFAGLVLVNSFNGLLVSFIFKPVLKKQVSSLEEMVSKNWYIGDTTNSKLLYDNLPSEYRKEHMLWCSDEDFECYDRLFGDDYAYFTNARTITYWMSTNRTGYFVRRFEYKLPLSFLLSKRSIYTKRMQEVATRMAEGGLVKLLDVYDWKQQKVVDNVEAQDISLRHLYLIFGVYLIGVLFAGTVFLYEVMKPRAAV